MVDSGVIICSTVTTVSIVVGIGLLLLVILLPLSFHYVRYDEYGLDYNQVTKKVNLEKTYEPGRHYLGVGHSFIKIPRTFQTIDFSYESGTGPVFARTQDGLSIDLEVSFQYRILPAQILQVFEKFAKEYNLVVDIIARNSIRDTASRYNAIEFFSERKEIGEAIESDLRLALEEATVTLEYLQLKGVDLPDQYEKVIELKEIERQNKPMAEFTQRVEVVSAETKVLIANKNAEKVSIDAEAQAEAIQIAADADAYATAAVLKAETEALGTLYDSTDFTKEQLLGFSWLETLRQKKSATLIVNLNKPAILSIPNQD